MTASRVSDVTDTDEDHGHGAELYIALVPWVLSRSSRSTAPSRWPRSSH
jgi:hypothetical protein